MGNIISCKKLLTTALVLYSDLDLEMDIVALKVLIKR